MSSALLVKKEAWNDDVIVERGGWLARELDHVWPGPDATVWDAASRDG